MAISDSEIAFALELFERLGPLTTRRMFGGMCLYRDGTVFALMRSDGELLLKAAGPFKQEVEAQGWQRWEHTRANGVTTAMPYWVMPPALLDDPDLACETAR
ncbi:MAG: TfoX/Sxy family protein, partial [Pseudomonadota bacterium]|nr:TfoX/Sxy family protein [Pseudomonadota bacterium]